jgi:Bifunctional DNA primase/polymerase, N-terminal
VKVTAEKTLAPGWPARTRIDTQESSAEPGPVPGQGPLAGDRWMLVWNRDQLGECCCWRGTVRTEASGLSVGVPGTCTNPGKHPWIARVDGEPLGFLHGAADAMEYGELADKYGPPGGARQLAVVLDDLLVVDLDGARALRDFARMSFTVPRDRIIGVSSTPRGFHVWLDCPGWNQKALNTWMSQWLSPMGGWDGTSEAKAGRRGFLVDVRTGSNRYVVWPGVDPARRWLSRPEFGRILSRALVGMPAWRMVPQLSSATATLPPWSVDTADAWLSGWIEEHRGGAEIPVDGLTFTGGDDELELTWAELERWLARLEQMGAGSGRNNALNQVAYFSGARCVFAGHPVETVRARIIEVGENVGTHGVGATVNSGLSAGMATLRKQVGQTGQTGTAATAS